MRTTGLWLTAALAVVEWWAVARSWRRLNWVAKPGTLAVLAAWLALQAKAAGWPLPLVVFLLGLLASLAGDVLLLLPARYFVLGLASFLLAHLAYVAAFHWGGVWLGAPGWQALGALVAAGVGVGLLSKLLPALRRAGRGKLVAPVTAYAGAICLMLFSALTTLVRPGWAIGPAVMLSAGAGLFVLSDSLLAWDRFVRPLHWAPVSVMVTYHLGQLLLSAAMVSRWAG